MAADLTITVPNEPGALAQIARDLADAGINISSVVCDGYGVETDLHVLAEDADAAREALRGTPVTIMSQQEVVVVQLEDSPGVLADLAAEIADAGVNLNLVYVAAGTRVVLGSTDMPALRDALKLDG